MEITNKPSEFIDAMLAGYEALNKEAAIPLRMALEAAKSRSRPEINSAGNPGARDTETGQFTNSDNVRIATDETKPKFGNNLAYLTDRIRTQHPEVFEGMERGEYSSVREAACAAGIRKPMVQHVKSVDGYVRSIRKHLSAEEIEALIDSLQHQVDAPFSRGAQLPNMQTFHSEPLLIG